MYLSTCRQEVRREETCQGVYLHLIGPSGNCSELWIFRLLQKCDLWLFSGNLWVDLARIHLSGQYLIKTCFKFGSKLWFFSHKFHDKHLFPAILIGHAVLGSERQAIWVLKGRQ